MRIKKQTLVQFLIAVAFVSLMEPNILVFSPLHSVVGLIRTFAFLLAVVIFLSNKLFNEKAIWGLLALLVCLAMSTLLYAHGFPSSALYTMRLLFTGIVLSTYSMKKSPKQFILFLATILSFYILMDGLTYNPSGTYISANGQRAFFLGTKTTITYYLVPAVALDYALIQISSGRERLYGWLLESITVFGAVIYLLQEPISTAIMCLFLLCICIIWNRWNNLISSWICKFGFWLVSIISFLFISGSAMGVFDFIFVNLLGETADMSGRSQIWAQVILRIMQKPIIGYGLNSGIRFDVWQAYNTSTHNFFLNLLFTMGIVGTAVYFVMIFFALKRVKDNKQTRVGRYLIYTLVIMNFEGISENYGINVVTFMFLVVFLYSGSLCMLEEELLDDREKRRLYRK